MTRSIVIDGAAGLSGELVDETQGSLSTSEW